MGGADIIFSKISSHSPDLQKQILALLHEAVTALSRTQWEPGVHHDGKSPMSDTLALPFLQEHYTELTESIS